jgi:hypothetical protein
MIPVNIHPTIMNAATAGKAGRNLVNTQTMRFGMAWLILGRLQKTSPLGPFSIKFFDHGNVI